MRGNYFHSYRPEPKGYASGWMIQMSNRRGIQGCDLLHGWSGDNKSASPRLQSRYWKPEYWNSIAGTRPIQTHLYDNIFESRGDEDHIAKAVAISSNGTYPNVARRQFGPSCLLTAPEGWFERHMTYDHNSTFINFDEADGIRYKTDVPGHSKSCMLPMPDSAILREFDTVQVVNSEG
jgi:hypothetical protein